MLRPRGEERAALSHALTPEREALIQDLITLEEACLPFKLYYFFCTRFLPFFVLRASHYMSDLTARYRRRTRPVPCALVYHVVLYDDALTALTEKIRLDREYGRVESMTWTDSDVFILRILLLLLLNIVLLYIYLIFPTVESITYWWLGYRHASDEL